MTKCSSSALIKEEGVGSGQTWSRVLPHGSAVWHCHAEVQGDSSARDHGFGSAWCGQCMRCQAKARNCGNRAKQWLLMLDGKSETAHSFANTRTCVEHQPFKLERREAPRQQSAKLHCAKSCRPFELFVNENCKL